MSEPDLKPCPFCGGQAHIMKMGYPHWVLCKQCGAKVHGGKFGEKEGEAASIEAWNRRTSYSCDHEKDHTADNGKKVCVDAISRRAAIDMLDEQIELCNKALSAFDISLKDEYAVKVEKASLKAYKEQLENILSVQPEPHWIPCSERLPEEGQKCLVCDKGGIGIDTYIGHGNPYNWKWYTRDYEAWQPLPEPYGGGEKE